MQNRLSPSLKQNHRLRLLSVLLFAAALSALFLSGCGESYPDRADDGAVWDKSWEMLGAVLGIEGGDGFTLLENDVVLAGDDTFYASWVRGEGTPFTNAEGKDTTLYPQQVHVLLYGCADAAAAESALSDFKEREAALGELLSEEAADINGQQYSLFSYSTPSDTNPYDHLVSAYTTYDHYAIVIQLTCMEDEADSAGEMLKSFLGRCHYSKSLLRR